MTERLHFLSLRRIVYLQHEEGSSGYLKQPLPIPLGLTRLAESRSLDHYCSLDSYGRLGFCWWGLIWVSDRMVYSCENLNSFINVEHWGVELLGSHLGPWEPLSILAGLNQTTWHWAVSADYQRDDGAGQGDHRRLMCPFILQGMRLACCSFQKVLGPCSHRWETVWRFLKKLKIAILSWVPILKKQKH